MEFGSIVQWLAQPGEEVKGGSLLCEVETDKATVGFEFQDDAVLAKILVPAQGPEIAVGAPVAITVEDAEAYAAFVAAEQAGTLVLPDVGGPGGGATPAADVGEAAGAPAPDTGGRSPSIQFLGKSGWAARRSGEEGAAAGGSAPAAAPGVAAAATAGGALSSAVASASPALPTPPAQVPVVADGPTTGAPGDDVAATTMRKVIAKRLAASKGGVPHLYVSAECELDALLGFRKELASKHGVKVSVNDLIIRSCGLALRDVPEVNASFDPATGAPRLNPTIDVSVAVATPGGLITPIVTGVDKRGLVDITATVKELAGRAREGKLQPHEFQGGTFSVSNLGMFGVSEFSAVINPPQAVIMAVGGGVRTVVPGGDGGDGGSEPRVATVMTARISCDRRVVDEALAGQFLQAFQLYMNEPHLLLL